MRTRSDGRRTRERIVLAAMDVFAERGFRDATHETIAKAAGANKALINHHFGDKKTLYREVWKRLLDLASREHPVSGGLAEGASAPERLEAHVRSLLTRHYGEGVSWQIESRIVARPRTRPMEAPAGENRWGGLRRSRPGPRPRRGGAVPP